MAKSTAFACGVSDAYYAPMTVSAQGVVSYGSPAVLGGTATVRVTPTTGENKVYESDMLVRSNSRVSGFTIEFSSRSVDVATEMDLLYSATAAASGDTGAYLVGPDNRPKAIAFGFARKRTDGKYDAYWYLNCEPVVGDVEAETAQESENTPANTYTFNSMPHLTNGKLLRRKVVNDAAALATFFGTVLPS